MGCGEAVNTTDFDPVIRGFKSHQPSYVPLAQLVEHSTFNRVVTSSNLVWHIIYYIGGVLK